MNARKGIQEIARLDHEAAIRVQILRLLNPKQIQKLAEWLIPYCEPESINTRKGEDIPVRENAPQKENSVATKPPKGNTNDS